MDLGMSVFHQSLSARFPEKKIEVDFKEFLKEQKLHPDMPIFYVYESEGSNMSLIMINNAKLLPIRSLSRTVSSKETVLSKEHQALSRTVPFKAHQALNAVILFLRICIILHLLLGISPCPTP